MSQVPPYRQKETRLKEGIRPELAAAFYPVSAERARPTVLGMHCFDKAHVVMLTEQSIIPRAEARTILQGFREMEQIGVDKVKLEAGGHPHSGENYLIKKLGEEVAGWIHVGRSSADLSAVSNRITQRNELLTLMTAIIDFRESLSKLAAEHIDTVMPGYSHIQHAQPLTFAHYLLSWVCDLERSFQRLLGTYERTNVSPAGAAVLTGSPFPVNLERTAELMGFEKVFSNTKDAVWNHDFAWEALSAMALLNICLDRLAEDLNLWSTYEFGMVELADGFCINSSILPQKKNPIALQYLRGLSGAVTGRFASAMMIMKSPSDAVVFDRHFAFDELWKSFSETVISLRLATAIIGSLKVNVERMEERAGANFAQATELASAIVMEKHLPWRTAQQITSVLVRICVEAGLKPSQVTSKTVDEAAQEYIGRPIGLSDKAIARVLDPRKCVQAHSLRGGPAPSAVCQELEEHLANIAKDKEQIEAMRSRLDASDRLLEEAIDAILEID